MSCSCRWSQPPWPPVGPRSGALENDEPLRRQPVESVRNESRLPIFGERCACIILSGAVLSRSRRRPDLLCCRCSSHQAYVLSAGGPADLLVVAPSHCLPVFWLRQPAYRSNWRRGAAHRPQTSLAEGTAAVDRIQAAIPGWHERSLVRLAVSFSLHDPGGLAGLALLAFSRL